MNDKVKTSDKELKQYKIINNDLSVYYHIPEAELLALLDKRVLLARIDELSRLGKSTYKLPNGFYGVSSKEIAHRIGELQKGNKDAN